MDMVIFFLLLFSFVGFFVFLVITLYSLLKKKNWKRNAYISGGLLLSSFLLFVFFGTILTDEDKIMTDQRSTIQAQDDDISDYEEQVTTMENEIEKLNNQIEKINEDKSNDEAGNEELESTIADLEETLENKDSEIEKLLSEDDDVEALNSEIGELEKSLEELEEENSTLSKENADLKEKNEELNDDENVAAASEKDSDKEEAEDKDQDKESDKTEDGQSPEQNIKKIIEDANKDVKDVSIEKEGDVYEPNITIDGTGYLWSVESSAKSDIADVVYALKESNYEYGFINVQVEMEFLDQYGNSNLSTGYEAEFTQEILDELTDDKYMMIDKIDGAANYWFAHPGI